MHLIKLKLATKNAIDLTQRLSSNMTGDDETNFPHRLMLTDRKVASLHKAFSNKSSTNLKFSKSHLYKIIQSGLFLGRLLGPLLKVGLLLIKMDSIR